MDAKPHVKIIKESQCDTDTDEEPLPLPQQTEIMFELTERDFDESEEEIETTQLENIRQRTILGMIYENTYISKKKMVSKHFKKLCKNFSIYLKRICLENDVQSLQNISNICFKFNNLFKYSEDDSKEFFFSLLNENLSDTFCLLEKESLTTVDELFLPKNICSVFVFMLISFFSFSKNMKDINKALYKRISKVIQTNIDLLDNKKATTKELVMFTLYNEEKEPKIVDFVFSVNYTSFLTKFIVKQFYKNAYNIPYDALLFNENITAYLIKKLFKKDKEKLLDFAKSLPISVFFKYYKDIINVIGVYESIKIITSKFEDFSASLLLQNICETYISPSEMNDEILRLFIEAKSYVSIPSKYVDFVKERIKQNPENRVKLISKFENPNLLVSEEEILEILKESKDENLLHFIDIPKLIENWKPDKIEDVSFWAMLISKFLIPKNVLVLFLSTFNDFTETFANILLCYDFSDYKAVDRLAEFYKRFKDEFPTIKIDLFKATNFTKILNEKMNPKEEKMFIRLSFWKETNNLLTIKSFLECANQISASDDSLAVLHSVLILTTCDTKDLSITELNDYTHIFVSFNNTLNDKIEYKKLIDFVLSEEFNYNCLILPDSFNSSSRAFFYSTLLFWNRIYVNKTTADEKISYFIPAKQNIMFSLFIGGSIIDKLPCYAKKTRSNAIFHCRHLITEVMGVFSNKELIESPLNTNGVTMVLKWLSRDIYTFNSKSDYCMIIAQLIQAYFLNYVQKVGKAPIQQIIAFLYSFLKTLSPSYSTASKSRISKVYGKNLIKMVKFFVSNISPFFDSYKTKVESLEIDAKFYQIEDYIIKHINEMNYLLFYFSFIVDTKEMPTKLAEICSTKARNKKRREQMKKVFVEALEYSNSIELTKTINVLLHFSIKFFPENYFDFIQNFIDRKIAFNVTFLRTLKLIGPQIFKKYNYHLFAIEYLLKQPIFDAAKMFLDIISKIVSKNDAKLIYVYQLLKIRRGTNISLCSLLSDLPFLFPDERIFMDAFLSLYSPIKQKEYDNEEEDDFGTFLTFMPQNDFKCMFAASDELIDIIEFTITKINDQNLDLVIILKVLEFFATLSSFHFMFLKKISLTKLFECLITIFDIDYAINENISITSITILFELIQVSAIWSLFCDWSFEVFKAANSIEELEKTLPIVILFSYMTNIDCIKQNPVETIIKKGWKNFYEKVLNASDKKSFLSSKKIGTLLYYVLVVQNNILSYRIVDAVDSDPFEHLRMNPFFLFQRKCDEVGMPIFKKSLSRMFSIECILGEINITKKALDKSFPIIKSNQKLKEMISQKTELEKPKQKEVFLPNAFNTNAFLQLPDEEQIHFLRSVIPNLPKTLSLNNIKLISTFSKVTNEWIANSKRNPNIKVEDYLDLLNCLNGVLLQNVKDYEEDIHLILEGSFSPKSIKKLLKNLLFLEDCTATNSLVIKEIELQIRLLSNESNTFIILFNSLLCLINETKSIVFSNTFAMLLKMVYNRKRDLFSRMFNHQMRDLLLDVICNNLDNINKCTIEVYIDLLIKTIEVSNCALLNEGNLIFFIKYITFNSLKYSEKLVKSVIKASSDGDFLSNESIQNIYSFIADYLKDFVFDTEYSCKYNESNGILLLDILPPQFNAKMKETVLKCFENSLKTYSSEKTVPEYIVALMNFLCPEREHSGPIQVLTEDFIEERFNSKMRLRFPKEMRENGNTFFKILHDYKDVIEMVSLSVTSLENVKLFIQYPELISFPMKHCSFLEKQIRIARFLKDDEAYMEEMIPRNSSLSISDLHSHRFSIGDPIYIDIERSKIIEDTCNIFYDFDDSSFFYSNVKIDFVGENGVDEGGLFKDWISSFLKSAFAEETGLFVCNEDHYSPNTCIEKNSINEMIYLTVGKILCLSLIRNIPTPFHMKRIFYKTLLGKKGTVRDIKFINKDIYRSILWIMDKENDDQIEDLCLTFTFNDKGEQQLLKENGDDILVTKENKGEYLELLIAKYTDIQENEKWQYKSIVDGFFSALHSKDDLLLFTPKELELALCGYSVIDVEDFIEHCEFDYPYSIDHPTIEMFFSVLEQLTNDEMMKLVTFITGLSHIPVSGFRGMHSIIIAPGGEPPRLPTSHTCSNMLNLPAYKTLSAMYESIKKAILECNTFGFA